MNSPSKSHSETVSMVKNTGIALGGYVFSFPARLLTSIVLTRTIGSASYGLYVLAISILTFFEEVGLFGLENTVIKYIAQFKSQNDIPRLRGIILWSIGLVVVTSTLWTVGLFSSAQILAERVFHKADFAPVFKIMALSLPFTTLVILLSAMFQGARNIKAKVAIQRIGGPLIRLILIGIAAGLGFKLIGMSWVYVMVGVIQVFLLLYFLPKTFKEVFKRGEMIVNKWEIFKFSTPTFFSSMFNRILARADILIMGYFLASSVVGVYGAAKRLIPIVSFTLDSVSVAFAPMISELYAKGEIKILERQFKTSARHVLMVSLPTFVLMALFARQIMGLFGPDFAWGYQVMIIVCLGELINAVTGSGGYLLMMTGRPMANFFNTGVLCVVNVLLGLYLIPKYGVIGAAWSSVIAISSVQILRLSQIWYYMKIHPYSLDSLKPVLSCALSALLLSLLFKLGVDKNNYFMVIFMVTLFITCYIFLLKILKLPEEDMMLLEKVKRKLGLAKKNLA